jgi:hypothetical protein
MQTIPAPLQTRFEKQNSKPERIFEYKTVDKSGQVEKWSSISRRADKITSGNVTLAVQNTDKAWNDILANPQNHLDELGEIKIGYTSIGYMTLFKGKLEKPDFHNRLSVSLSFRDRISYFTKKRVGSSQSPADYYSASSYTVFGDDDWSSGRNPAHLLWHLLTFWGGLDNTESVANTDIDWNKFETYRILMDSQAYLIQAQLKGDTLESVLREFYGITLSTVFSEADGKVVCKFWLGQDTADVQSYSSAKWKDLPMDKIERMKIVNKYIVYYGYDPSADTFTGSETRDDATSISDYGLFDKTLEGKKIWHYSSASAINVAERLLADTKDPFEEVEFTSFLLAYRQQLWDALKLTDTFYGWTDRGFRIENLNYNINDGTIKIFGRLTDLYHFLILDDAVYGKLDTYNALA